MVHIIMMSAVLNRNSSFVIALVLFQPKSDIFPSLESEQFPRVVTGAAGRVKQFSDGRHQY